MPGCDSVIHLACISNDPSFELNPDLGKSINYDAFRPLVKVSKDNGVNRFIYASSSSVYGVKEEENVTEELSLEPLTDYSKYKVLCEEILSQYPTSRIHYCNYSTSNCLWLFAAASLGFDCQYSNESCN